MRGPYSEAVLDLFDRAPRAGRLAPAADVFSGVVGSVADGVRVQFQVCVRDGVVADTRFLAYGCPHTVAAAARVAEGLVGAAPATAGFDPHRLAAELEVPDWKLGRLLVVEDALRACLAGARANERE